MHFFHTAFQCLQNFPTMHNSYNTAANFAHHNGGGFIKYIWDNTFSSSSSSANEQNKQQQQTKNNQSNYGNNDQRNNNSDTDKKGRKKG